MIDLPKAWSIVSPTELIQRGHIAFFVMCKIPLRTLSGGLGGRRGIVYDRCLSFETRYLFIPLVKMLPVISSHHHQQIGRYTRAVIVGYFNLQSVHSKSPLRIYDLRGLYTGRLMA